MSTRTLITALLATALAMPAMAQTENPAAAPQSADAAAASVQGAAPTASTVSRDKDTLSVDFPDEDIKTILRNVADLFELNLVVPDTLSGKVTIKLRDVTWRQIFQTVLAPVGYTYIEEGNIIKIVSNELLQQEPVSTEVFILNNAKASDIKPTIDGLIDAASGGKIVIDGRSNALVITERPSRMGRIRLIIEKLDKATDQVMIESKFVEVTDRDIRDIGVNWTSLKAMQLGVGDISQTFTRDRIQDFSNQSGNQSQNQNQGSSSTTGSNQSGTSTNNNGTQNVTYVTGFNNPIASTTSLPSGNVTFPVNSVPSTTTLAGTGSGGLPTASTTYQGQLSDTTTASTNNTTATQNLNSVSSAINALNSLTNGGGTSRVASAVFSASDFNVILSALKTQNNTKIMSNPTVVTLNNTEATLNIGQEFPVPNYTYNSERGNFEVSGFTYKPIGIILKVTPQVNAQGVIKLALEPEVSQRNGDTSFGGTFIPIVATRKVKTNVSLKDGYTMGIGGLITQSQNHGSTKVPVLGDIPLLGRLFSSKSVNDDATNLLIFITAKTVSADGASPEEVFDPRAIEAVGMSRDDLPPHRAPKGTSLFTGGSSDK
ncbi:MAG: secretin and TonB N-terminal domain-containing protein [Opitutaceae bacterium]|nr:secretin and TonB N-terminal domain-containing protein [Opitutaceae bacterium]